MLYFTQKIIENLSNKVSTLSYADGSRLSVPIVNGEFQIKNSNLSKSIYQINNQFSLSQQHSNEIDVQQNLVKSRRSKESIELKRQIIKKMNQKILNLQKRAKTKKIDLFQLEAYKNDLLGDFLQYQKSKRMHQEEINDLQTQKYQQQKSFFFMSSNIHKDTEQKNSPTFKGQGCCINRYNSRNQKEEKEKVVEKIISLEIIVPILKLIQVEIPLLNLGSHKTGSTEERNTKQSQDYLASAVNQIKTVNDFERQQYQQLHLPLNSSRSQICMNQGRILDLNSQRSGKSIDYRHQRRSDRFFMDQQQLMINLNQKSDKMNIKDKQNSFECILNQSMEKNSKNSVHSQNRLQASQQLKLTSSIQKFSHSKGMNIELQRVNESYKNQAKISSNNIKYHSSNVMNSDTSNLQSIIIQLKQELRQKQILISSLIGQNNHHLEQIVNLSSALQSKDHQIQSITLKIQLLEQKFNEQQKQLYSIEQAHNISTNKLMNQIYQLSNELQSKNQELSITMDSLEILQRKSYEKQKDLLNQMQGFENHIAKLKEQIQFYKKRFHQQGIKLSYAQVQLVEQALQDRQKLYESNIQKLKSIYQQQISQLKSKYNCLQIQKISILAQSRKILQQSQLKTELKSSQLTESKISLLAQNQIRQIIEMYDKQLQTRDEQLIAARKQLKQCQYALVELLQETKWLKMQLQQSKSEKREKQEKQQISISIESKQQLQSLQIKQRQIQLQQRQQQKQEYFQRSRTQQQLIIQALVQKNRQLEQKYLKQRNYQKQLRQKLFKLDNLLKQNLENQAHTIKNGSLVQIPCQSKNQALSKAIPQQDQQFQNREQQKQDSIIQRLASELQKQQQINKRLKSRLNQQKPLSPSSQSKTVINLKSKIQKLTKYSKILQKQITQIYKVNQCQSHHKIISRLEQELEQYRNAIDKECQEQKSMMMIKT